MGTGQARVNGICSPRSRQRTDGDQNRPRHQHKRAVDIEHLPQTQCEEEWGEELAVGKERQEKKKAVSEREAISEQTTRFGRFFRAHPCSRGVCGASVPGSPLIRSHIAEVGCL